MTSTSSTCDEKICVRMTRLSPWTVCKCVGPRIVPFFKTCVIFFVLFGVESRDASVIYAIFKVLPIGALIVFVLLHGMDLSHAYAYSRKIIAGLIFSAFGDIFLVWKKEGFFYHGVVAFAIAQAIYASAFGWHPIKPYVAAICFGVAGVLLKILWLGLDPVMTCVVVTYLLLINTMLWRAIARVHIFNDLWTWTKLCSCIGAFLFVLSDLVIAIDRFLQPVPYSMPIVMFTYYAAQMGITLSVVDSQADALVDM